MTGGAAELQRPRAALIAIALAFFVAGFLVREDYGTTWDEAESYQAGQQNLDNAARLLRGDVAAIEWPWHELMGHQLVVDTSRSAFARAVEPLLPPSPAPIGEHLFNLTLTSASLFLVGWLCSRSPQADRSPSSPPSRSRSNRS